MRKFPLVIPPIIRKPHLPIHAENKEPYSQEEIQRLLALASGPEAHSILFTSGSRFLATIIDPATGDSPLHRAASAGIITAMEAMSSCFGRNLSQQPREIRLYWTFMTHQNKAGDTALHSAARSGNQAAATAVYGMFQKEHLTQEHGADAPEDMSWEDSYGGNGPALLFLVTKNKAGRDAAAEARHAGHVDVAAWLEALTEIVDFDHKRADEAAMRQVRRDVLDGNWYLHDSDDEDGKEMSSGN